MLEDLQILRVIELGQLPGGHVEHALADQLLLGQAVKLLEGAVDAEEVPLPILVENRYRDGVHQGGYESGVALEGLQAALQLRRFGLHFLAQGAIPGEKDEQKQGQATRNDREILQREAEVAIRCGAVPFGIYLLQFLSRDQTKAGFDLLQQCAVAFLHGAVKTADVEGCGCLVAVDDAELVEIVEGWRLIHHENVDLMISGGPDDGLVTVEEHQAVDAALLEDVYGGIARFGSHDKSFQRGCVRDARDLLVEEDRYFDLCVGAGKVEPAGAFLRLEDGVDDVELARLHAGDGVAPIEGADLGLYAGLLLPQAPLVDQNPLLPAVAVFEAEGGVVVIHHHPDGAGGGTGGAWGG